MNELSKKAKKLKQNRIVKAGLAYLSVSWLIIQVSSTLFETFEFPSYALRIVFFVLGIGFPIYLILYWKISLKSDFVKIDDNSGISEEVSVKEGQRLNRVIIGALSIAVIILITNLIIIKSSKITAPNEPIKVNRNSTKAKKPTLMVVPSDAWCFKNGYVINNSNNGAIVQAPDYKRAFQENVELLQVISKINGLMSDRGFPLKNMESVIKTIEFNKKIDENRKSKQTNSSLAENQIDILKNVAKADIIIQMTWSVYESKGKKSVTFNLQGLDSYTDKQIATASGTGMPSFSAETAILLNEAVLSHVDSFVNGLQSHFDDIYTNGRETIIRIKKWEDWEGDLEKEFNGQELGFIIEDWLVNNTVKGSFNTTEISENMAIFEQVRIPIWNENGRSIDARTFLKGLSEILKNKPYYISNKITSKGLGEATIILGNK
ncbi:DUF6175 family protein [Winogradskyella sp. A2]|uniref:DUF6175 family protein n=1 Tax=Winogradskyella sp. A2 TaxID=3366944 RepID=UPI00398C723A